MHIKLQNFLNYGHGGGRGGGLVSKDRGMLITRNQWSVFMFSLNCISLRMLPCGHLLQYKIKLYKQLIGVSFLLC